MNFGSGFRHLLHQHCNRGAFKVICAGVISMYIGRSELSASYMAGLGLAEVSELFQIPFIEEKKLNDYMSVPQPGPLQPLVSMLHKVLTESGQILIRNGYDSFAAFILANINPEAPKAEPIIERLITLFPAFNDVAQYNNRTVSIFKKAQLVVCDLYRFKGKDKRFNFMDIQNTVFTDNVLPAVLRKYQILVLSDSLREKIDSQQILPRGNEEIELRLCAVHACELIIEESKKK